MNSSARKSPQSQRPGYWLAYGVLGALLLGLLIYLALREDYWPDEGFTIRRLEAPWAQVYYPFADQPSQPIDPFDIRYVSDFNPPLYFMAARLLAGPNPDPLTLRLFSIVPILAMFGLIVWAAAGRFGPLPALGLAIIFCLSPQIVFYGHEARPYAMAMFAVTALIMISFLDQAPARLFFVLNLGITLIACLIHYHVAWVILTLMGLYAARALTKTIPAERQRAVAGLIGLIGGSVLAMIAIMPTFPSFAHANAVEGRLLSSAGVLKTLFFTYMNWGPVNRLQWLLWLVSASLFTILLVTLLVRSPDRRQGGVWLMLWLIPAVAPMLIHGLLEITFFERYALFAAPGFLMLLGWMIRESLGRSRVLKILIGMLMASILFGELLWIGVRLPQPLRENWQPAIERFYAQERMRDYYSVQPIWYHFGFIANAPYRPKAAHTPLVDEIPSFGRYLWILSPDTLPEGLEERLDAAGWRLEEIVAGEHLIRLWRAERAQ